MTIEANQIDHEISSQCNNQPSSSSKGLRKTLARFLRLQRPPRSQNEQNQRSSSRYKLTGKTFFGANFRLCRFFQMVRFLKFIKISQFLTTFNKSQFL